MSTQTIQVDPIICEISGGAAGGVVPVVTLVSPASLDLAHRYTPVVYTVSQISRLRRVIVRVRFPGRPLWDFVYDGSQFSPMYLNGQNRMQVVGSNQQFTFLRDGGWPGQPLFTFYAINVTGQGVKV